MPFKKFKTYCIVVIFLAFANVVLAQRELYNWQLTPYVGLLKVDKNINLPEDVNQFAYGLRLDKRISSDFTVGFNLANLYLGDTTNRNITGFFLSVGYNWDNGYLLSDRAFLSPFHRLEGGYANRYSSMESMSDKNSDFGFGIENGIKLRFGDRITADLAFALFASKSNLTEGDIRKNVHYNVWRLGISYFFGNRQSTYVAPVFVPRNDYEYSPEKIHPKDRWIVEDSVYNEKIKIPEEGEVVTKPVLPHPKEEIAKSDSLKIFMHFDSLYVRRDRMDELIQKFLHVDSLHTDTVFTKKIKPIVPDTLQEFWSTPIDSLRDKQLPYQLLSDSLQPDTSSFVQPMNQKTEAHKLPSKQSKDQEADEDSGSQAAAPPPAQRDTIFMEGRVDTIYVQDENGSQVAKKETKASNKNYEKELKSQSAEINRLEKEVEKLKAQRDKDTGKILGAGATGAAIGAAAKDKKSDKDTVYVDQSTASARIDSLERELAALKNKYNENITRDSTKVEDSSYTPYPPIGQYFDKGDSLSIEADSLYNTSDTLTSIFPDSTHQMVDEAMAELDTISLSNEVVDDIFKEGGDGNGELKEHDGVEKDLTRVEEDKSLKETAEMDAVKPELKGNYPIICNFDLNRSTPSNEELQKLEVVVNDLKLAEKRKVILTGFTDKSGKADYNLALSEKRANAIKSYLVSQGISEDRIEINAGGILDSAERYSPTARRVEVEVI